MSISLLNEPASDWTKETLQARLHRCAQTLYVHNLLPANDMGRIEREIRQLAALERSEKAGQR